MKNQLASLALLAAVGCALVSTTSLKDVERYRGIIGQKLVLLKPLFLVKDGANYKLVPERKDVLHAPVRQYVPSFEEFKDGEWIEYPKGRWGYKYLDIVGEGNIVEVADIVKHTHVEVGITYEVIGVLKDYKGGSLSPIHLKWFYDVDEDPLAIPFLQIKAK